MPSSEAAVPEENRPGKTMDGSDIKENIIIAARPVIFLENLKGWITRRKKTTFTNITGICSVTFSKRFMRINPYPFFRNHV